MEAQIQKIQLRSNNPVISNINNEKYATIHELATRSNRSNINQPRDNKPPTRQYPETSRTHTMQTTSTDYNTEQEEGNYLSTSIINSLITKINSENTLLRETELDDVKSVKYKIINRKFSVLSYMLLKLLSNIQGITNKEAIATEQIRR
ncbi:8530_t:CDS:2 [Cetraspora pellucida]|uniref:8530_t:CDS:1 n=1 Tax=Cetraspora pellucida TaxID=1433469 RepID=A0A9N9NXW2_9GLOM|nr:8530_t:CDS:2 [Cetraspora pellucida]